MNAFKILTKKLETLSVLFRVLLLQRGALEEMNIDKVVYYSLLVREKGAFLSSLDRIVPLETPGYSNPKQYKCLRECSVPTERDANNLVSEIDALSQRVKIMSEVNIGIIESVMGDISRQSASLKLLKRGHSVYTNLADPGYIDITG